MYISKEIEFNGASGKTYSFTVYPKSGQLPESSGLYILTYIHPRGHIAGFKVNIIAMGEANNLNAVIDDLRQEDRLLKECWNYSCIMTFDNTAIRQESLEDLSLITSKFI
jgi:hypothetical protein